MARRPTLAKPPTTDDAIELALEAEAEGRAAEGPAARLIARQAQLVGWQIATERASFALKLLTAVVGVIVAVVVGAVLYSASQYRGLTVQPFSVPPELEARGLNGSAVATRLLDKLTTIQARTDSIRATNSYANSWGDAVEVEIPQTGVSAGEMWRFLRSWLGEEVKITGEVVRTAEGLQITARAGGEPGPAITGAEAELEAMLDRAAEAVYGQTQPYRYAVYLGRTNRVDEAMAAFADLAATGDETDRKWALAGWSLWLQRTGDQDGAIEKATQATELDPEFGLGWTNLSGALFTAGRINEAVIATRRAVRAIDRGDDIDPRQAITFLKEVRYNLFELEHDHRRAAEEAAAGAALDPGSGRGLGLYHAMSLTSLHEISEGRRIASALAEDSASDAGGFNPVEATPLEMFEVQACWVQEMWTCYLARARTALAVPTTGDKGPGGPFQRAAVRQWQAGQAPAEAFARARMGDVAGARALVAVAPPEAYFTLIARAAIAEATGDRAGADRLFARAVRSGVELADADQAWGRAKLARGDATGAIKAFEAASRKAPRWAAPLKYWGDALMAQGRASQAIAKYRQAAERAPNWGGLRLAQGRALERLGRRDQAREHYRHAARLDLAPAERTEVSRQLAAPST